MCQIFMQKTVCFGVYTEGSFFFKTRFIFSFLILKSKRAIWLLYFCGVKKDPSV
jgi:hypothetical protein